MPNPSEEPAPKKGKVERTCSNCKVTKCLDGFSKSQRSKGASAKCMECVTLLQKGKEAAQQQQQQKRLETQRSAQQKRAEEKIKRQKSKAQARKELEDENKLMEDLDERSCAQCNITKKKDRFNVGERKRGKKSVCDDCIAEAMERQKKLKEEQKRREAEERKKIAKENEENEEHLYKTKKELYDQYIKALEDRGTTIEKEMTLSSDLVYVVTSIRKGDDQFSPHLHGIFTTCKQAQECARKAFTKISESYRDGKFIPNDERIAKFDISNFLNPGVEFKHRVLYEVLGENEEDGDCNAVAINAVHVDNDVEVDLPFMKLPWCYEKFEVSERTETATPTLENGTKVYAIFSHFLGHCFDSDSKDVSLCGVYTNREDAIQRGLEDANMSSWNEEAKEEQMEDAKEVTNGKLFCGLEDEHWAIALETLNLDEEHGGEYGKELDIGSMGSEAWMGPFVRIEYF